jgi:hypothetical protein
MRVCVWHENKGNVLSFLRSACDVLPTLIHVRWMNGGKEEGGGGENENVSRLYCKAYISQMDTIQLLHQLTIKRSRHFGLFLYTALH